MRAGQLTGAWARPLSGSKYPLNLFAAGLVTAAPRAWRVQVLFPQGKGCVTLSCWLGSGSPGPGVPVALYQSQPSSHCPPGPGTHTSSVSLELCGTSFVPKLGISDLAPSGPAPFVLVELYFKFLSSHFPPGNWGTHVSTVLTAVPVWAGAQVSDCVTCGVCITPP